MKNGCDFGDIVVDGWIVVICDASIFCNVDLFISLDDQSEQCEWERKNKRTRGKRKRVGGLCLVGTLKFRDSYNLIWSELYFLRNLCLLTDLIFIKKKVKVGTKFLSKFRFFTWISIFFVFGIFWDYGS